MRYTFPIYSGDGDTYAPDAFAKQVGKPAHFRDGDKHVHGTLLAATVDEDGGSVRITLDIPDKTPANSKRTGRMPGRPRQGDGFDDHGMFLHG